MHSSLDIGRQSGDLALILPSPLRLGWTQKGLQAINMAPPRAQAPGGEGPGR